MTENNSMRIAYLFPHYAQKAGTERILIDKMNWLAEKGYSVYALSYEQGDHADAFPLSGKVKRIDFNVRFFPLYRYHVAKRLVLTVVLRRKLIGKLRDFVSTVRPDLMVCTTYAPFEIAALTRVCQPLQIPFVIESHSTYLNAHSTDMLSLVMHRKHSLSRRQLAAVNRVVALTDGDAAEWRRVVSRVEVIPNMVHLNDARQYASLDSRQVIFAGRLEQQKGLPELLAVWQSVHQTHPDWTLHVYGTGPQRQWFVDEVERRNIGIVVHEPVADIMTKYKESSMLMLTSVYEPFGLVLVEAMSCGLPVVSFDSPYGPADIITDGQDGYLVEQGNVEAFADRLRRLMDDPQLRKTFGQRAIVSSQRFAADKVMPRWEQLFTSLISPSRSQSGNSQQS